MLELRPQLFLGLEPVVFHPGAMPLRSPGSPACQIAIYIFTERERYMYEAINVYDIRIYICVYYR